MLVNNAGLGGTANVVDMTDDQWDAVLGVTLTGTFRCTRAASPAHARRAARGVIVNNASVIGWRAQAGQAHYAAAKAGVMALTRCAAIEAAPHGVRVNAVAPSLAMHPFLAKVTTDELLATLTPQEAFGRAAEPWEVANVIVFLASDYASYLTGEVISVSSQHLVLSLLIDPWYESVMDVAARVTSKGQVTVPAAVRRARHRAGMSSCSGSRAGRCYCPHPRLPFTRRHHPRVFGLA